MKVFEKHVFVCTMGKTCAEQGGEELCSALRQAVLENGLKGKIRVNKAGCFDQCGHGPMVVVYPEQVWYAHVSCEDVPQLVAQHLIGDKPVERLLYDGSGRLDKTKKTK